MQKKRNGPWLRSLCSIFFSLLLTFLPGEYAGAETRSEAAGQETEQSLQEGVDSILGELDLDGIQGLYEQNPGAFGGESLEEALANIAENGLNEISAEQAINAAFSQIKDSLFGNVWYIVEILIMLLATAFLHNLQGSFDRAQVSKAAFWAAYVVICTIAASMITQCVTTTKTAMEQLFSMVETITPVLITLLTGMGGLNTSNIMNPVMAGLTGGIFAVIKNVVFPAILVSAVFAMASNLSTTIRLKRFSGFMESCAKWFLGIILVVFIGITTIKGLTGAAIDGLSFKTAKFTVDKMVPVIGGMFSETLDTLMACSLIVKNAVGVVGLILLVCALAAPLATLIVNLFLLKFAAAVAEPFSDERCVAMLSSMGNTVMLLFVTLLTCVAMAFIVITLLMGTADISMMMR